MNTIWVRGSEKVSDDYKGQEGQPSGQGAIKNVFKVSFRVWEPTKDLMAGQNVWELVKELKQQVCKAS